MKPTSNSSSTAMPKSKQVNALDRTNTLKHNSKLLNVEALNLMLFKIKKYYNEINKASQEKKSKISTLKEESDNYDKKIIQLEQFKDIEFEKENISVKEMSSFSETKKQIQERIEKLIGEKKMIDLKYRNECDYTNTLKHLIDCEKEKNETLNDKLLRANENMQIIKSFKKNLDSNEENNLKKQKQYKSLLRNFNEETETLGDVIKSQEKKIEKEEGIINDMISYNLELQVDIENRNSVREKELEREKEKILEKMRETEDLKRNKIEKESVCIKLILGLDIIKKYYLDVDKEGREIDNINLEASEDMKTFSAQSYNVYDMDNATIILNTHNSLNEDVHGRLNSTKDKHKQDKQDHSTTTELSKIYLREIKDKFDHLDVDFERLYNFYSKIINKTSFYHHNMMNVNLQIIKLENLKDIYTVKVKEIMRRNYTNFGDLAKTHSKLENFMKSYQDELRTKGDLKKTNHTLKDLNSYFSGGINFTSQYNDLYNKSVEIISNIKAMYEFLYERFNTFSKDLAKNDKETSETLKKTSKLIKTNALKQLHEFTETPKEKYFEDMIQSAMKFSDEWKSKIESEFGFSIECLHESLLVSPNKEFFLKLELPIEKNVFYFFSHVEESKVSLASIYETVEMCLKRFTHSRKKESEKDADDDDTEELLKIMVPRPNMHRARTVEFRHVKQTSHGNKKVKDESEEQNSYYSTEDLVIPNKKDKQKTNHNKNSDSNSAPTCLPLMTVDQRIIDKFYKPFIEKHSYRKLLNDNISEIKKNTRWSAVVSHKMSKSKKILNGITKELVIFNNPSKISLIYNLDINVNRISNTTYNSFIKHPQLGNSERNNYKTRDVMTTLTRPYNSFRKTNTFMPTINN